MTWLVLDLSSAPIADAFEYVDGTVKAPANYKDPEKISEYIAEQTAKRVEMAATDMDLARISGIGYWVCGQEGPVIWTDRYRAEASWEAQTLKDVAGLIADTDKILTFGGHFFDLPMLMRRARYLGVTFPWINVDKYRSPHLDLCDVLSDRNPSRMRPLTFYAKRLKMGLTKPLSGAEEAQVYTSGNWDDLADSLNHDVCAIKRLAEWAGVIK
jgi:DNA polymerase elongation subunit (family B)